MNIAVILAGGTGSRIKSEIPKQFVKVYNKPILIYTIELYEQNQNVDLIEIVCHSNYVQILQDMLVEYGINKVKIITEGGSTCLESTLCGINQLQGIAHDDDIIIIQVGACPNTKKHIIENAIAVCNLYGDSMAAQPLKMLYGSMDTSKSESTSYIDRNKIVELSTPQCFKYSFIKEILNNAETAGYLNGKFEHLTSLMFKMGYKIHLSEGDSTNIKITTEDDIQLFKGLLLSEKHCK